MAQDMLSKVRALIDTAESYAAQGNTDAEATYRRKAQELMVKYRIEEENLVAADPTSAKPELFTVNICRSESPYVQSYLSTWHYVAEHAGIKYIFKYDYNEPDVPVVAKVVGYEGDVRYAEMLYTAVRLVFTERMEPTVNRGLSDEENVYRLRSAGIERVRIARMMGWADVKASYSRVGRLYKAECARRNETPALDGRGVTGAAYRESYAQEFP